MANPRSSWGGQKTEMAGGCLGSGTADTWDSDTPGGGHTHMHPGCRARAPSRGWGVKRRNRWGLDSPHPPKGQVISVPAASQGQRATSTRSCEDSSLAEIG